MRFNERWKTSKRGKKPAMSGRSSILYRKQVAALIADFRKDGCLVCGEKTAVCLTAHHKEKRKKSFGISRAIAELRVSPERLKVELEKCVCLCFNCHAKVEAGLETLPSKTTDAVIEELRQLQATLKRPKDVG